MRSQLFQLSWFCKLVTPFKFLGDWAEVLRLRTQLRTNDGHFNILKWNTLIASNHSHALTADCCSMFIQ